MTKKEYLECHAEYLKRMSDITARKNHDYTGNSDDPFNNFKTVELSGICSTEQGFLVRLTDKFSRIASFVKQGVLQVKDESIEDTLLDAANYCLLMAAYIKSKKQEAKTLEVKLEPGVFQYLTPGYSAPHKYDVGIVKPKPGQFWKRTSNKGQDNE